MTPAFLRLSPRVTPVAATSLIRTSAPQHGDGADTHVNGSHR